MRSSTLRPPVANGGSCPRTSHPTRRCRVISTLGRAAGSLPRSTSNTTLGLNSVDRNLAGLFQLNGAAADASISQIAGRAAFYPRRFADCRRPVADRRGGRRNRCGLCWRWLGLGLQNRGIRLPSQHSPNVRRAVVALRRRNCHLWVAGAHFASDIAALARECARKGKLMASSNVSSQKIDLLISGPSKPLVISGFSDQFVLHAFETKHDLERLSPAVAAKIRGVAVTFNTVRGDSTTLA